MNEYKVNSIKYAPEEIMRLLYSKRTESEKRIKYEDYIKIFDFIVVDDEIYVSDDCDQWRINVFFERSDYMKCTVPSVIIKNGYILKNRYGYK